MVYKDTRQMPTVLAKYSYNNPTDTYYHVEVEIDDHFSVRGEVSTCKKPGIDKYIITCGCVHEEMLFAFPELKPFIDLHLCSLDGKPMYPLGSSFYFYAEGVDEHGKRAYLKSEAERKELMAEDETKVRNMYIESVFHTFSKTNKLSDTEIEELAFDIWNMVNNVKSKKSRLTNLASFYRRHMINGELLTKLVVERKNNHLANILRISLEDAEAIPPNLTKDEFNNKYVIPNYPRWQQEADQALELFNQLTTKKV